MSRRNQTEFRKKVTDAIYGHLRVQLERVCDALVVEALKTRTFVSFTGNTLTSYSCGLYLNGSLVYVIEAEKSLREPIRRKIQKGRTVRLKEPYEGNARAVTGRVEVDGMYGSETAMSFLTKYKAPKKGFAIVMTTGTEYSEYIEKKNGCNVLSTAFSNASRVLFTTVKPIP